MKRIRYFPLTGSDTLSDILGSNRRYFSIERTIRVNVKKSIVENNMIDEVEFDHPKGYNFSSETSLYR